LPPESNHTFKLLTTFLSCNFSNYQETDSNCYFFGIFEGHAIILFNI